MMTLAHSHDAADLLARVRQVRADAAARWGRMSAHQMVCHLSDCFRMVLERKTVRPASGPLRRTVVKWIALYLPVRWPRGLRTRPEIDQTIGGTRPIEFRADLSDLERLLLRMAAAPDVLDGQGHPVFGRLSAAEWLRWAYLHVDHHLRQFGA